MTRIRFHLARTSALRLLLACTAAMACAGAGVGCGGGNSCVEDCSKRCEEEAKNNCPAGRICFCDPTPCFKACGY